MAVVFLFRAAVAIGSSVRVARSASDADGPSYGEVLSYFRNRGLFDGGADDGELAEAMSEYSGYAWSVASYTGSFELRKLHVIWSQDDAATPSDDSRIATFHFAKIAGGVPVDTWDAGDFATLQSTLETWWTGIKDQFTNKVRLDRMKVYKAGPEIEPPQVPVYDADLNIPGTSALAQLPPQVAVSVTEKAGSKRHWGRFYLPSPSSACLGVYGRLEETIATDFINNTDTWYEALRAAAIRPVVYRPALPVRQTAQEKRDGVTPGSLPARDASAWDVTDLQVDDVLDVIRSRRFKNVSLRVQRALT